MDKEEFTGRANLYKKFRPTYPKELIDYLYSELGFTKDSIIADIGAGTGIFTRLLLECGNKVYAVEPNKDMQEISKKDLSEYQKFIPVNAPAESTELENASVDFITIAQAFYWFDRQLFKHECQRILKSDGKVIILQNEVDKNEMIMRNDEIIIKYRIHVGNSYQYGRDLEKYSDFFVDGIYEYKTFKNDLYENREYFIGRNLSNSKAPREEYEPEKYHGFVKELNELFDKYSINGILHSPQITKSYIGKVK